MRRLTLTLILLCIFIQGCVGAFLVGAATGGILATERRDLTTVIDDQNVRYRIQQDIQADPAFKNSNVVVTSYNHTILLVGQTPRLSLKEKAQHYAKLESSVNRVFNQIQIKPIDTFSDQASDSWITTKVKSALIRQQGITSSNIKVVTENGSVYLLGLITKDEADTATETTRRVSGVKRVVKLFEYKHSA